MKRPSTDATLNKKRYGRCRVCQKFGRLTREHVPPKSAFNDRSYLEYYTDEVKEAERIQWETRDVNRKGIYLFTLCEKCNNKTGRLYGTDYAKFVQSFSSVATPDNANSTVETDVKNFFPVRVVKQVVSMILSTSHPGSFVGYEAVWNPLLDPEFSQPPDTNFNLPDMVHLKSIYDELRGFVKNKDAKGLPSSVKLYTYAVANKGVGFRTGIAAHGKRSTKKVSWLVVVGLWPMHWLLVLDGDLNEKLLDVTDWAKLNFKDKKSKRIQAPCRWSVGKYPLDSRSPDEFMKDHFAGVMRLEGFVPESGMSREQFFEGAISFARRRGRWTREGYLITELESGTYYEAYGHRGWLEGWASDEAREFLKKQLAQGE